MPSKNHKTSKNPKNGRTKSQAKNAKEKTATGRKSTAENAESPPEFTQTELKSVLDYLNARRRGAGRNLGGGVHPTTDEDVSPATSADELGGMMLIHERPAQTACAAEDDEGRDSYEDTDSGRVYPQLKIRRLSFEIQPTEGLASLRLIFSDGPNAAVLLPPLAHALEEADESESTALRLALVRNLSRIILDHDDRDRLMSIIDACVPPEDDAWDAMIHFTHTGPGDEVQSSRATRIYHALCEAGSLRARLMKFDWRAAGAPSGEELNDVLIFDEAWLSHYSKVDVAALIARSLAEWGRVHEAYQFCTLVQRILPRNEQPWIDFVVASLNAYGGVKPHQEIHALTTRVDASTHALGLETLQALLELWPTAWVVSLRQDLDPALLNFKSSFRVWLTYRASICAARTGHGELSRAWKRQLRPALLKEVPGSREIRTYVAPAEPGEVS